MKWLCWQPLLQNLTTASIPGRTLCFGLSYEFCANTPPSGYLTHDILSGHSACGRQAPFPLVSSRTTQEIGSSPKWSHLFQSAPLPDCALCGVVSVLIGSLVGRDLERCSKEVLGRGMSMVPSRDQVPTILAGSSGGSWGCNASIQPSPKAVLSKD